jgi:hypothetical protein
VRDPVRCTAGKGVKITALIAVAIALTLAVFFAGYFLGQSSVHYESRPGTSRIYAATVTPTPGVLSGRSEQELRQ